MRKYETTFIIDGLLNDTDREAVIQRFENLLNNLGEEIISVVRWGHRQLAYEIKKRTRGYYVIFYYNCNPSNISAFHRELEINEYILRYLTIKSEGKHPDYIRDQGVPSSYSSEPKESMEISENVAVNHDNTVNIDVDIVNDEIESDVSHNDSESDEEEEIDVDMEVTVEKGEHNKSQIVNDMDNDEDKEDK